MKTHTLQLLAVLVCVLSMVQAQKVLLLGSDQRVEAILGKQTFTVTKVARPDQYTGSNPAPTGFDVIVLMPVEQFGRSNIPAAGQAAIVAFSKSGKGVVMLEWTVADSGAKLNYYATLLKEKIILAKRTGGTYLPETLAVQDASHPAVSCVPATFSVPRGGGSKMSVINDGTVPRGAVIVQGTVTGGTVISANAGGGLGRRIHLNTASKYFAMDPLCNANWQSILVNAVKWAAGVGVSCPIAVDTAPCKDESPLKDTTATPTPAPPPPKQDPFNCSEPCLPAGSYKSELTFCDKEIVTWSICPTKIVIDGKNFSKDAKGMDEAAKASFAKNMVGKEGERAECPVAMKHFVCAETFKKCAPGNSTLLYPVCQSTCWNMRRPCRGDQQCDDPTQFGQNAIGKVDGKTVYGSDATCTSDAPTMAVSPLLLALVMWVGLMVLHA